MRRGCYDTLASVMSARLTAALCTVLLMVAAPSLLAGSSLQFVETQDLRVLYYDPPGNLLVPLATQSLAASLETHRRLFGYSPKDKINVLLQDFSDVSMASTMVAPRNRIFIDMAPQSDPYEYTSAGDLLAWLSAHETMSLLTYDKASAEDERYRRWFHGKVEVDSSHPESLLYRYLTTPRAISPRWYSEGIAVFTETWMMGGVGRAQGGYDEMVFRGMVKDGAHFYDPLGLVSKGTEVTFQTGADAYLYGTRFMNYLAFTYDPAHLVAWWSRDVGSRRYYAEDFERVFGLPLEQAWQDWIRWEQEFQTKNLESIRERPLTPFQDLVQASLGTLSRTFLSADRSTLYAALQRPGQMASLVAISRQDGQVTYLHEVESPSGIKVTSLAYDPATETLFYTSNNAAYRNLEAFNVRTHASKTLLKQARIGDIAFNAADRSLWGIRFNQGLATLVKVAYPYREWQVAHVFKIGERPFDVDVSADGQWLAFSVSGPGKSLSTPITEVRVVRVGDMERQAATPYRTFTVAGAVPEGFVFSRDGRYLYGSSYYTGVSNIYRYDLEHETIEAVSNAELGFFSPLEVDESHWIVSRFSSQGFIPSLLEVKSTNDISAITFLGEQVAAKHPELQAWMQPSAATIPFAASIVRRGTYHALQELDLQSLVPMVEGYKQSVGLGFAADFSDPMGFAALSINASYSPDRSLKARERTHLAVDVQQGRWMLGAKWNGANFYDLFGPVRRSREGYSGYVHYDRPLVFHPSRTLDFVVHADFYGGIDVLPGVQNVRSPSRNLSALSMGFRSTSLRSSPGSVDYEAGQEWMVMANGYGAAGDFTPSLQLEYHVGLPLAIDHSSLWLRTAAVVSGGALTSPLSNTYLGGFGNNYVDSRMYTGAQRYRGAMLSSMPGFDIGALSGRTLGKLMLEWCLPPLRFEHAGSPGMYLNWVRPELFASVLATNPDNSSHRDTAHNVGLQVDFNLTVMQQLPMKLSIGVAKGFGGNGRGKSEFMLSLLVL